MLFGALSESVPYNLLFLALYFEVFLLLTFLEKRHLIKEEESWELKEFPAVSIIVPCFNEEHTIQRTVESLHALNYPQQKLSILVIDYGSTDNTWKVIQKFKQYSNVGLFHKENGGKFTALNFGLEK